MTNTNAFRVLFAILLAFNFSSALSEEDKNILDEIMENTVTNHAISHQDLMKLAGMDEEKNKQFLESLKHGGSSVESSISDLDKDYDEGDHEEDDFGTPLSTDIPEEIRMLAAEHWASVRGQLKEHSMMRPVIVEQSVHKIDMEEGTIPDFELFTVEYVPLEDEEDDDDEDDEDNEESDKSLVTDDPFSVNPMKNAPDHPASENENEGQNDQEEESKDTTDEASELFYKNPLENKSLANSQQTDSGEDKDFTLPPNLDELLNMPKISDSVFTNPMDPDSTGIPSDRDQATLETPNVTAQK